MAGRTIKDWFILTGAALSLALPVPASALVVGDGPEVVVDLSALDGGQPEPRFGAFSSPGLLMPGARHNAERVHLSPPGARAPLIAPPTGDKRLILTPPGAARPLLVQQPERIVLSPPPGVTPLYTPPKRSAAIPAKPVRRPSAAEIEAEVGAPYTRPEAAEPRVVVPEPAPVPEPSLTQSAPEAPTPLATPEPPPMPEPAPEPTPPATAAAPEAPATPEPPQIPAPPAISSTPQPMPEPPSTPRVAAVSPAIPAAPAAAPQAETPAATIALAFEPDDARLNETHRALLKSIVARMNEDPDSTVQLLAYAQADNRSKARRLSLSRALAVRSYLLSQDVRNTRIEVRALGDQIPSGKPDRVDVVLERH